MRLWFHNLPLTRIHAVKSLTPLSVNCSVQPFPCGYLSGSVLVWYPHLMCAATRGTVLTRHFQLCFCAFSYD